MKIDLSTLVQHLQQQTLKMPINNIATVDEKDYSKDIIAQILPVVTPKEVTTYRKAQEQGDVALINFLSPWLKTTITIQRPQTCFTTLFSCCNHKKEFKTLPQAWRNHPAIAITALKRLMITPDQTSSWPLIASVSHRSI